MEPSGANCFIWCCRRLPGLQEASWKGGELRTGLREPFENLMLSNRASLTNGTELNASGPNFDNWR
jgi:hypothetical protein